MWHELTATVTERQVRTDPMNALDLTSRDYWRKVLDAGGFTAIPRWAVNPVVGVAEHKETISDDLAATLRRLADEMSLSVGSVLLTAHAKVLAALSSEMGVLTGYVAVEGEQPLPCRLSTKPDSWRSLLVHAHRVEKELLSHKEFPVDDLGREMGQTDPAFEAVFDPTDSAGALANSAVFSVGISQCENQLGLRIRYRTEAIDKGCAARIAGYHLSALKLIAADPNAEHGRQSLLSAQELDFQIEGLAGPRRELPDRRFHELFEERARAHPDAVAGMHGMRQWTYRELNARANRLGRALLARGLRHEGVVAVVTERNLDWMAAVLAVFKAGGVYLPVEPELPANRIAQMLSRAECKLVLTETGSTATLEAALDSLSGIQTLFVDAAYREDHREDDLGIDVGPDQLAYIYFTSGSTGEPKGAMCEHAGMLNHLYAKIHDLGIDEGDVVTEIARQCFDISLWQLVAGLLVGGRTLIIEQAVILDLQRFVDTIVDGKVSVVQVVPSYLDAVLSYLEKHPRELPDLKCVSVTGEALKAELARRWFAAKPSIKLVNAYGLTETSDDTNHEVMERAPDGDRVPLGPVVNNVHVYVVDAQLSPAPLGAPGEIVFSGVCVGRGYVNDPERTRLAFVADPLRKGERLYRSGDFGRWRPDGKLEFLGRRDAQVKINGFRIEIGDIENALLRAPGVLQGAVVIAERADKSKRLVAFYASEREHEISILQDQLRQVLPAYMVPSTFHWQESLPLTANGKVDRKNLTALAGELGAVEEQTQYTAPTTPTERFFCEVLAGIMRIEQVSVDSHLFYDLGADSLVVTAFCARLRARADLPPISTKDVYQRPTIRSLAAALTDAGPALSHTAEVAPPPAKVAPVGASQVLLCGALQFLSAFGYAYLVALVSILGYNWISAGSGFVDIYCRAILASAAGFLGMCLLPIVAKWTLIGRWKPGQIRVWSLNYFRFWLVKTLVRYNPLVLFAGSPIFTLYLRALGAKIGRDVLILSPQVPVCTDLLTIGDNTVICKDSFFSGYRARDGVIHTGPVTIGKNAYVGEMTLLEIGSSLGDGSQLGHSSSLHTGQSVPNGERRCGSPARQRTKVDYRRVDPAECGDLRKIAYSAFLLLNGFVISAFLVSALTVLIPAIAERLHFVAPGAWGFSHWTFYGDALIISLLLFVGSILLGLIYVVTVPRLLNLAIKPDKVYPLYGFHYWVHRAIGRMSNVKFFNHLFGDSSYVVHYLRAIGYDLSQDVVQTGSNFGSAVKHDNPFLVSVGRGTMIADGLSLVNADYSNASFRVARVKIGPDNFLGNAVVYPSQGRTGANCLLATKVMVPVDGDVREGIGLLGSPSFEIPRSVQRDIELKRSEDGEERDRKLAAKNRHNLVTLGLFLLAQWFLTFLMVLLLFGAGVLYDTAGVSMFVLALVLTQFVRVGYHALVERASTLFQSLQPQQCSIHDPYFWYHERYWKLGVLSSDLAMFDGTPFKSLIWRLLGVRIGKRVFDDGCYITERTMVSIGDGCTLNSGSVIQSHSQEDGGFKSDCITIGAGCTLGVNSLVHYGVKMGDGAQLSAGAFLMKGEEVPPQTRWEGNPASQARNCDFASVAAVTPHSATAAKLVTTGSNLQVQ
jgi:non-ribosomal peptide synthetase-like protein